jgi:hypothetical protein
MFERREAANGRIYTPNPAMGRVVQAGQSRAFGHFSRMLLIAAYAAGMESPAPMVDQVRAAPSEGPERREPHKKAAQIPDLTATMRFIENVPPGA